MDEHNFNLAGFLITFPLRGGGGAMLEERHRKRDHLVPRAPTARFFHSISGN
jgi:hypothetical protein